MAEILKPTGFFNAKTKAVMGLSAALAERFGGKVPNTLEELVTLPGVGRKTANVVLGNAFGVPGITVDTHFGRLSRRFGWTTSDDPVKVEAEVGELIPKSDWVLLSHRLIWHGRRICHARKPACGACPVADWCPSFGLGPTDAATAAKLVKARPVLVTEGDREPPGWLRDLAATAAVMEVPRGRPSARLGRPPLGRPGAVRRRGSRARPAVHPAQRGAAAPSRPARVSRRQDRGRATTARSRRRCARRWRRPASTRPGWTC